MSLTAKNRNEFHDCNVRRGGGAQLQPQKILEGGKTKTRFSHRTLKTSPISSLYILLPSPPITPLSPPHPHPPTRASPQLLHPIIFHGGITTTKFSQHTLSSSLFFFSSDHSSSAPTSATESYKCDDCLLEA